MHKTEYIAVIGIGEFPADMLRYDGASPAEEVDSHAMAPEYGKSRMVVVKRCGHERPQWNRQRWKTFTWECVLDRDRPFYNVHDARRAGLAVLAAMKV